MIKKKFKSITVPQNTYEVLNQLKDHITEVPLSTSKVVSILAQKNRNTDEFITVDAPYKPFIKIKNPIHEKERSNEPYIHKKPLTR